MKTKIAYITKDDKMFLNKSEAIEHEAKLFGLTVDEYHTLEKLEQIVRDCSFAISYSKNEETEKAFDKAINDVIVFRKAHNLDETDNLI